MAYAEAGWPDVMPLPRNAKKNPPAGLTGKTGRAVTPTDRESWATAPGELAVRMPADVVALDADTYGTKDGAATLASLEAELGTLPATWTNTGRGIESGSGHRLYRLPAAYVGRELADLGGGVEVLHRGYRYAVAWPSVVVDDKGQRVYRWYRPTGEPADLWELPAVAELPELPEAWAARLVKADRLEGDFDDEVTDEHKAKALAVMAKMLREPAEGIAEAGGRNNYANKCLHTLYGFAKSGALQLSREQIAEAYREAVETEGGFDATEHSAWEAATPQLPDVVALDVLDVLGMFDDEDGADFWQQTPVLAQIEQAARARIMSRDAALALVLARVLADVPPNVVLPPVTGSRASLNLGVALVGPSGAGKSSGMAMSSEVLGIDQGAIERPVGSGEGIAEAFLTSPEKNPATGKREKRVIDDPRRILIGDEVDQFAAIKGRAGASLGPVVRSALTGGTLGQLNAAEDRRRNVPANSYRAIMLLGVQPTRSGAIIEDEDAGTPQRFLWASTLDAGLTDEAVDWPGSLGYVSQWVHVPEVEFDEDGTPCASLPVAAPWVEVEYPEHVKAEIRANRLAQMQGKVLPERGHLMLTRLKVATALAFLHNDTRITDQWWDLAGQVIARSQGVLGYCKSVLHAEAEKRAKSEGRVQGLREVGAAEVRAQADDAAEVKLAAALWRIVDRHRTEVNSQTKHEPGEPCTGRCLNGAVRRIEQSRRAEAKQAALDLAEERGWVVVDDDGKITTGASRPAE